MKLCRFQIDGHARNGIVEDGFVVDRNDSAERHPVGDVRLLAPVQPRKYLAIGLNYADHIAESGLEAPEVPFFFNKQVTCVVGPGDDVHMPRVSKLLDYEAELAIVIGKRCRHVPVEQAAEVAREPFPEGLLKVGDVVRIEIEGIGELQNTVVDEPDGYVVREAEAESLARLRVDAPPAPRPLDAPPQPAERAP